MDPITHYSLEDFAERHRADFDLHEPRPELWNGLEQQLEMATTAPSPLRRRSTPVLPLAAKAFAPLAATHPHPLLRAQRRLAVRWQYAGLLLGLLALVLAASLGERWKASQKAAATTDTSAVRSHQVPATALYLGPKTVVANEGGPNGNARLDTAVHGMERYYTAQLAGRQAQLNQLAPDKEAEWTQDLASLDSVYQQLKRELPQHPQPEVVLTAMNRNLQTRLDILDQQLELRGGTQLAQGTAANGGEYALADSRAEADNLPHHHAR